MSVADMVSTRLEYNLYLLCGLLHGVFKVLLYISCAQFSYKLQMNIVENFTSVEEETFKMNERK